MNVHAWPPEVEGLQVDRELRTLLSAFYFSGEYVYKVKRPLKFDAVDFSTLAAREKACNREVRLNQRFPGNPHVDVVPLYDHQGHWTFTPTGEPVEYCVRMNRLPEDRMLDGLLTQSAVAESQIQSLVTTLANFYREAKTSEKITKAGISNAIESSVRLNMKILREQRPQLPHLDLLESALLEYIALNQQEFADRASLGKIRDGHGDLRPEHICLTDPPAVFDCIEFHDRYRHIDILDDLAGLVMEVERTGHEEVANWLRQQIHQQLREDTHRDLFAFYGAHRAVTRAKFIAQAETADDGERQAVHETVCSYLHQAAKYGRKFHHCRLLVIFGLLGTGKSTLSQALANSIGIKRLSTEAIRQEMFIGNGAMPQRRNPYSPEERDRVYGRLFDLARQSLEDGTSVVLDASFTTNQLRQQALKLAEETGAEVLFFECRLSKSDAIARLDQRFKRDRTNAAIRPEYYEEHQQTFEPSDGLPADRLIPLTTTMPVPELVDAVLDTFKSHNGTK